MEVHGRCQRCGGIVRYHPAAVGASGDCDLCGERYRLVNGRQERAGGTIDLTDARAARRLARRQRRRAASG